MFWNKKTEAEPEAREAMPIMKVVENMQLPHSKLQEVLKSGLDRYNNQEKEYERQIKDLTEKLESTRVAKQATITALEHIKDEEHKKFAHLDFAELESIELGNIGPERKDISVE